MTLPLVRPDTLPENTFYPDDGCEVAGSCFDCPLPVCKHDDPRATRRIRNRKIIRAHQNGTSAEKIATRLGWSVRVVYRVIGNPQHGLILDPVDTDATITLAELATKSVFHAHEPWPEIVRYE